MVTVGFVSAGAVLNTNDPEPVSSETAAIKLALDGVVKKVVATKGDLLDQQRKLAKSGLEQYFHHIEIMSDKQESDYLKLIKHLDVDPAHFTMIGNSLKSDILPVLAVGGHGIHVPYHTTWAHEVVSHKVEHENFREVEDLRLILNFI